MEQSNAERKRQLADRVDAILGLEGFDALTAAALDDLAHCECDGLHCRTIETENGGLVSLVATGEQVRRFGEGG